MPAVGAENLKGGAWSMLGTACRPKSHQAAPVGVSVQGPKPVGGWTTFFAEGGKGVGRKTSRARERRGGTGEPNSRYDPHR